MFHPQRKGGWERVGTGGGGRDDAAQAAGVMGLRTGAARDHSVAEIAASLAGGCATEDASAREQSSSRKFNF